MSNDTDRLDDLFAELRAKPCRPASIDVTLEDRVMKEFANVRRARQRRGRLAAAVAAMALVIGVAGAAGAFEAVKGWFGKVELVSPDGKSTTHNIQGNEVLDDEGNAVGQLTITGEDGEHAAKCRVIVERSTHDQ
jgi:hypothetical protein